MDGQDHVDYNPLDTKEALKEADKARREKLARWQKIRIDQFGYSLNLFIILSIAALGYWFDLLKDLEFHPDCVGQFLFWLAMPFLALAVLCGGCCTLCRLWDFRGTTQRAMDNSGAPSQESLRILGKFSWALLIAIVATFGVGIVALGTSLIITYWHKH